MSADRGRERSRSALTTLSVVGAALAGVGVGALLGTELRLIAWWILAIGIVAHLVGMAGVRKLLSQAGYEPPGWQVAAYWLCWTAIAGIIGYGFIELKG